MLKKKDIILKEKSWCSWLHIQVDETNVMLQPQEWDRYGKNSKLNKLQNENPPWKASQKG